MTQRRKTILIIFAILLFITAFILDLTNLGHDWDIRWNGLILSNALVIIAIIMAIGLFLGLFLFRSQKYKHRILVTISIAAILFSLTDISKMVIGYYGLDEDYNYFTAKNDISKGKIQTLQFGMILPNPKIDWKKRKAAKKVTEDYFGYKSLNIGCGVTNGIDIYNCVMEDYLEEKNGKDWRVRQKKMFDSLMNLSSFQ